MKTLIIHISTSLLCSILFFSSAAQNAKQDFQKINNAYAAVNDLSMDITYTLYESAKAKVSSESYTGCFKQHGALKYSKLKDIESIQNKECSLVIDNDEKLIVIANPVKGGIAKISPLDLENSLKHCSSVEFLGTTAGQSGYKLVFKQNIVSEFDAVILYFNSKTFLIEKMVMYYRQKMKLNPEDAASPNEKPRLEIVFSNTSLKSIDDITFFSAEKYIEKKQGKYYTASAYKGYELLNHKTEK